MDYSFETEVLEQVRRKIAHLEFVDDEQARELIAETIFSNIFHIKMSDEELKFIADRTFYRIRKPMGILTPLIEDKKVTEIMVNGSEKIFIEREGLIRRLPYGFASVTELEELMQRIASGVHREINELHPIVDARLEDGSRVNGVYKNIAANGPILTIRKFSDNYMKLEDLVQNGTINEEADKLLRTLVMSGFNIFVSGGTSSGKTTLLNALGHCIPEDERVIVIEDSMELQLNSVENLVQMECRQDNLSGIGKISIAQLIRTSLRMRPDRIIVGEVRGEEVLDMLQAMNTGHAGSMSTGHGNSIKGMLRRLEAMFLMAMPLDIDAVRAQIAEGIDIMIHIEKYNRGRRITEIIELVGYENGRFILNPIMTLNEDEELTFTGNSIVNSYKLKRKGIDIFD
ncbi:MAG: CpaF family protein [Firmicutes bacterium]|nr:CpaF family protein [Bacillota bacterium]